MGKDNDKHYYQIFNQINTVINSYEEIRAEADRVKEKLCKNLNIPKNDYKELVHFLTQLEITEPLTMAIFGKEAVERNYISQLVKPLRTMIGRKIYVPSEARTHFDKQFGKVLDKVLKDNKQ